MAPLPVIARAFFCKQFFGLHGLCYGVEYLVNQPYIDSLRTRTILVF